MPNAAAAADDDAIVMMVICSHAGSRLSGAVVFRLRGRVWCVRVAEILHPAWPQKPTFDKRREIWLRKNAQSSRKCLRAAI